MPADGDITQVLRRFVACELLGEPDSVEHLTDRAPLLEWGILDSLNTARLLAFLSDTFAVDVPVEAVVAEHFRDIASIARLVREIRGGAGVGRAVPRATGGSAVVSGALAGPGGPERA